MVNKVVHLEIAIGDLKSIYNYISHDSVKYAKLEVKKIKAYAESLKKHSLKRQILSNHKRQGYTVCCF